MMKTRFKTQFIHYLSSLCETAALVLILVALTELILRKQPTIQLHSDFVTFTLAFPLLFSKLDQTFGRFGKSKLVLLVFMLFYLSTVLFAHFKIESWSLSWPVYLLMVLLFVLIDMLLHHWIKNQSK
ncbi:hypothetical protein [Oenococcus sicerae]|uniref:hypothetical protein n=1 Tax=Oenococcus sicerae TaxID=2203724 RepID=UPI0010BC152B|nr:hypothetical protein OAL24_01297 [Oenococcus sicerae]